MPDVYLTPLAERGAAGLRGPARKQYDRWLDDLAARGCAAMGYRLTGDAPLSELCCTHLRGADRVIVAFNEEAAWVLIVGPHDRQDQVADVYRVLYDLVGHESEPLNARTKPPCCDEDGLAPLPDKDAIDRLVERGRELLRRRR